MSIFRKAEELNNLPNAINEALFDNNEIVIADDFEKLLKEASSKRKRPLF